MGVFVYIIIIIIMIIFILGKNAPKHNWSQFPKCETRRKQSSKNEEVTALKVYWRHCIVLQS